MYFGHNSMLVMDRAVVDRGGWCSQFCLSISQNLSQHTTGLGKCLLLQCMQWNFHGLHKMAAFELYFRKIIFVWKFWWFGSWKLLSPHQCALRGVHKSYKCKKMMVVGIFFLPLSDFLILSSGGPKFPLRCVGTVGRRYLCRTIYIFY